MKATIGLIDGNNFFASCERSFQPKLQRKPLIILSSNDGCVIARSNEAKALGIGMGVPLFTIRDIVQKNGVEMLSSNFSLYGDISKRMMGIIQQKVSRVEIASVDEAFMDMKDVADPLEFSGGLHEAILKGLGLPTCIGLSCTKTLAKLANYLAKKRQTKVYKLEPHEIPNDIKVEEIWGVGRQMARTLHERGVNTARQLQEVDPRWMRQRFSVVGERIVRELQGLQCLSIRGAADAQKSIQVSRSFGQPVTKVEDLCEAVAMHVERLGEKLRQERVSTDHVTLFVRSSSFHKAYDHASHQIMLDWPTQDTQVLLRAVLPYVDHLFKQGTRYQKAGLLAANLIPSDQTPQRKMFLNAAVRPTSVSRVLDAVVGKYGRGKLGFGSLGMPALRDWMVKCNHQTPHYTTRWKDLLTVG